MTKFKITTKDVGIRLDSFVAQKLPQFSRSFLHKRCELGEILVNGESQKPKYKLHPNDLVKIVFDTKIDQKIPDIELTILYEDDDCLVINKPPGILTHSKGAFNPEATVATFISNKVRDMDGERAGIVHRLDRATSGLLIAAKNPESLAWLQKQFSQRKVNKTYFAIIEGHLSPKEAIIDMPIERHPRTPKIFRTSLAGKPAKTEYKVEKSSDHYDLVKLQPQTGRTHQLRVHLKQLHHPIVGDTLYDGKPAKRLYLHAEKLELTLLSRERKVFEAKLPDEFHKLIDADGEVAS